MKKILSLLAIFTMLFAYKAEATHYAAVDIYYEYLAPLSYKVHLIIYRDCEPGNATVGPTDFMCVASQSCGQTLNFNVDTTGSNDPLNGDTLDQLCPGVANKCQNTSSLFVGFEYWHYVQTVNLPAACNDWKFIWNTCCRNTTSNLTGQPGISVAAELNNLDRPVNSSVRLSILPIPYVCNQQVTNYLNGPVDPDNDSIVFVAQDAQQNGSCATSSTAPCPYQGTYTGISPIPLMAATNYVVNPQTGVATFQPNGIGNFVLAFRADEYDKITGVKVGSVMRDVQISIVGCNAAAPNVNPPTAPVVNNLGNYKVDVCPGFPLQFSVTGSSAAGGNNLFVYGNQNTINYDPVNTSPPTLVASAPGGGSPNTATFSWTPTANDYGAHTLIITFSDSTCTTSQPIVIKSYATVLINVLPGVSGGGPYDYCPGGSPVPLSATGPIEVTSWSWVPYPGSTANPNLSNPNISNPTASPSGTVQLIVTGLPNSTGCPNKDTVTVTVHPALVLSAGADKFPCANDAVALTGTTNKPGGIAVWTPNTFVVNGASTLTLNTVPLGSMGYELYYKDPNNCVARDSVYINTIGTRPILGAYPAKNPVCVGEPLQLFANASPQPCGKSANQCSPGSGSKIQLGANTIVNNAFSPFYRDFNSSYRVQYLYLAEELKAAGISPGNIKGLSFDLATTLINPTTDKSNALNVKLGCTNQTSLNTTTGFTNGLYTVFNAASFTPTVPTTDIAFPSTNQFYWDGKTNLLVEFCYSVPQFSGATATPVFSTATPFQSCLIDANSSGTGCNLVATAANSLVGSLRPNIKFDFCKTNTFKFNWTPAASFVNSIDENPFVKSGVITASGGTFNLTVSSDTALCSTSTSVTVNADVSGVVEGKADNQYICFPGLVTLQADPKNTTPPVYTCGEENAVRTGPTTNQTVGVGAGFSNSSPFSYYPNSKYQYILTKAMLNAAGITGNKYIDSISLNVLSKNSTVPFKDFSVFMGCTPLLTMPESYINLGANKLVFSTSAYQTSVGWNTFRFQNPFLWDGNSNVVVELCYSNAAFANSFLDDEIAVTSMPSTLNYQQVQSGAGGGCSFPTGTSFAPFQRIGTEYPNTRIYSTDISAKPFNYVWEPSLYVNDTTKQNTLAYVPQTTIYTVSLINKTGCKIKDTAKVEIVDHFVNVTPEDTSFCNGDAIKAYSSGPDLVTPATYLWSPNVALNTNTGTVVTMSPSVTTLYNVVRTDRYGCKDTAYVNAQVIPTPNVTISNGDSVTVLYDQLYNLNATGAQIFNWSPSWGFDNPNISNPTMQPREDGLYFVYGLDSNSCRGQDSIWMTVTKVNPVAMPTVFSPNGDGVNDVFRVANMKFEKVQNFRVFNRWGEEVYSAIDNKGWDGSYKGKTLDMDTYFYNIILAYPDGTTKTLNGEIVLMR